MLPNKVKIGGINYDVQEVRGLEAEFSHLGQILYTRGVIKVDEELSADRKEQVFVHELLHGVFYEAGIEEQDEDMINRVSIILHQVLKDNNLCFGDPLKKLRVSRLCNMPIHPNTLEDKEETV
ncbi:ImmA/IrrE family metallo-endopeptidase [Bacillus badius]|uniref:Phage protein n=1 Tax=Bacillus badius TaxID=1455 RepID=A0ABR5AY77_BACBA|nr:ImmA/IrrE family metallo-endopeptidase [Bacillus badius]KIL79575.1 Phage protein [Bacillus badius]MED4716271.1 ImmA/IrrE family metallo-endopeptidase [Bacillus badius]